MKSNVCEVKGKNEDLKIVLNEVEKAAGYNGLERKKILQLQLLSEELIGIQKGILGFVKGEFYMENTGDEYRLCLHAEVHTDILTQERFVQMATNHKNEAAKGVVGKIKYVVNYLLSGDVSNVPDYNLFYESMNASANMMPSAYDVVWSFGTYRDGVSEGTEEWDEMEHSIVANLADDLIVGATANTIDLIAVKKF